MSITILFPMLVAVMYAATGIAHLWHREYGWALMWWSYAMANVGLIIAQRTP